MPSKLESQFSEANWGDTTLRYAPTVERVSSQKYATIIDGARAYCRQRKAMASRAQAAAAINDDDNDRGMLEVSSDIDLSD